MGNSFWSRLKMKVISSLAVLYVMTVSWRVKAELTCSECIAEMKNLGDFVKGSGATISRYLADNYCPTTDDPSCTNNIIKYYVPALRVITERFIIGDAMHVCQLMMACETRQQQEAIVPEAFTCHDCVEGLKFIRRYLLDEFVIDEFILYLDQNFCLPDMDKCNEAVRNHFPAMHIMAMEEFFNPREICIMEDVCDP